MLDTGKDAGWFDATEIVALTVVAAIGFCAFLIWELGDRHPIVDLSFFRQRNFAIGTLILCIGYAVFFGNVVILPLWLQTQLGYTATWAGLVQAPAGLVALLVSPFAGRTVHRYDARWYATFSFIMLALGLHMRAQLNSQAAFIDFVLPMMVQGVSMAFFFVSMITISLDGLTPQQVPAANGIANFLRITAAAFSTSIATTMWENRATLHQGQLAEASSVYSPTLQHAAGTLKGLGLNDQQALGALTRGLVEQSVMLSSLDYFWISTWMALGLVGLVWLTRRPRAPAGHPIAGE
jgi:DHA2 family multidrug resistance protein